MFISAKLFESVESINYQHTREDKTLNIVKASVPEELCNKPFTTDTPL